MKSVWKRIGLSLPFLLTYLLTVLVGAGLALRRLNYQFQYDLSVVGFLSFLYVITLVGGCSLLVLLGLRAGLGNVNRMVVLLIVLSTAALFVFPLGWPVNLFVLSLVALVGETTLLSTEGLGRSRHLGVTTGVLLVPFVSYSLFFSARRLAEDLSLVVSAIFIMGALALLPLACVWLTIRYPDVFVAKRERPRRLLKGVIVSPFLLVVALLASVAFYVQEYELHKSTYGHEPPYGIHADIVETEGDIGIPGITKLYEAHLFNFAYLPKVVERCDYMDDVGVYGTRLAYTVQRWDLKEGRYVDIAVLSGEKFCKPYPLGIIIAKPVRPLLLPGHSLRTNWEATAARFHKGDKARFVVLTRLDAPSSSNQHAFPTPDFIIDEEAEDRETDYRIMH